METRVVVTGIDYEEQEGAWLYKGVKESYIGGSSASWLW